MKIKNGYILREMSKKDGIFVVVSVGEERGNLKGYITLNESGAFIWKLLEKGATKEEIVQALLSEYEVEKSVVEVDVESVIQKIKSIGALDDWRIYWNRN